MCFETGKELGINYDSPPRATWTMNSFAGLDDKNPVGMNEALSSLGIQGDAKSEVDSDAQQQASSMTAAAATALMQGKAKGMRTLEQTRLRAGGYIGSNG